MSEQDELKTAAELEAEARARARAETEGDDAARDAVTPGQPQVVKHQKRKSRRTMIVLLISVVLVGLLAFGGDYLLGRLKGDRPVKDGDGQPQGTATAPARERQNLGRDLNPLGALADSGDEAHDTPAPAERQQAAPGAPESVPAAFDKTLALADSSPAASAGASRSTTSPGTSATADRTADAQKRAACQRVLTRDAHGALVCPDGGQPGQPGGQDDGLTHITGVKRLGLDPDLYIPADQHIPCGMMQRFVSDVGGRFTCQISEDIYSANNRVRLIPAGTIARGLYRTGTLKNGQGRLFLAITELRTPEPNRLIIPMMNSQAVGALGENGVAGWIDNHWLERIGNTLLLGTVQDFAAAAAGSAPSTNRNTDYTENTRAATAEMAKTVLENSINIPPTMYLNQGDVIGLVTGADIDFSDVYRLRMR
jgi:type IV secretion system protein VirB10